MRRRFAKREPIGVTARRHLAHCAFVAGAHDKVVPQETYDRLPPLPKTRGPRIDHEDLEKHVISAVGELLSLHPKVLLAVRQNTGSLPYDREGKPVPIWFYKLLRTPEEMTVTDFWGLLRDGRPLALEAKRPSWKWSGDDRELKQRAFIQMVEAIGGVGGFVRSAEEAQAILQ